MAWRFDQAQERSFGGGIERPELKRAHRPAGGGVEPRPRIPCRAHKPLRRPEFTQDPGGVDSRLRTGSAVRTEVAAKALPR